jgi:hypothetical protein
MHSALFFEDPVIISVNGVLGDIVWRVYASLTDHYEEQVGGHPMNFLSRR